MPNASCAICDDDLEDASHVLRSSAATILDDASLASLGLLRPQLDPPVVPHACVVVLLDAVEEKEICDLQRCAPLPLRSSASARMRPPFGVPNCDVRTPPWLTFGVVRSQW